MIFILSITMRLRFAIELELVIHSEYSYSMSIPSLSMILILIHLHNLILNIMLRWLNASATGSSCFEVETYDKCRCTQASSPRDTK